MGEREHRERPRMVENRDRSPDRKEKRRERSREEFDIEDGERCTRREGLKERRREQG